MWMGGKKQQNINNFHSAMNSYSTISLYSHLTAWTEIHIPVQCQY